QSARPSRLAMGLVGVAAAVLGAALALGAVMMRPERRVDTPTYHVNLELGSGFSELGASERFAVSPDGQHVVFVARRRLWVRALRGLTVTALEGTEGASGPFWSADGKSIGYFVPQEGVLKRIDLAGGPAAIVTRASFPFIGATWNRDGIILLGGWGSSAGIQQVAAAGGELIP